MIVGDDCTMSFLRRETVLASLLACLPLMACESPVNSGAAQVVPLQKPTLDGETCDHSGQCEGELRCVDSICQTSVRSRLGDYYAAAGRVAMQSGDGPGAANEFNLAVTQYETDKVDLPNDVLCGQGRALALARTDIKLGEAAARVLHRCILTVPANSAQARSAMTSLVSLLEVGLDPSVLSREEIGDLYLSGKAQVAEPVEVSLVFRDDGKAKRKRGFATVLAALQKPESATAFKACVPGDEELKAPVEVSLPFSFRYIMDEDDEARDRFELSLESAEGTASAVETCVRAASQVVIDGLAKEVRDRGRWKSTVTLTLSN